MVEPSWCNRKTVEEGMRVICFQCWILILVSVGIFAAREKIEDSRKPLLPIKLLLICCWMLLIHLTSIEYVKLNMIMVTIAATVGQFADDNSRTGLKWSQCFLLQKRVFDLEFHPLGSWWFNVFQTIVLLNVTKKIDWKGILNWWTILFWCRNGANDLWFLPSPAEVSSWSQTYWMLMLSHSQLCIRRFLLSLSLLFNPIPSFPSH